MDFSLGSGDNTKTFEFTTDLLTPGYWVKVVPRDADGGAGKESNSLQVPIPGNEPPVADVTAGPATRTAPLTVNFDARGSSAPDGTIILYEWDFEGDGAYDVMFMKVDPSTL